MTIQELIKNLEGTDIRILVAIFLSPPILAWLMGRTHRRGGGEESPWRYFYSLIIYLVCLPGVLACVLTAYSMFFIRQNLLQVNVFVHFLPILCMISTLVISGRNVELDRIPGVDRLYALMTIVAISFGTALAVQKTRIWILFGGSIASLLFIALFCFIVLKWSWYKLFGKKEDSRIGQDYIVRMKSKYR